MAQGRLLRTLKAFRLRQWLVLGALIFVLGMGAYYTIRVVRFAAYSRQNEDAPIRGWMKVGNVARSHRVPVTVLNDAIGLPADSNDRRPLVEIAKSQNRSFDELQVALSNAIVDYRASHPEETGGQD